MYVTAIVVAAGRGIRFSRLNSFTIRGGIPTPISKMIGSGNSRVPKTLIKIDSKPIIIYCLRVLNSHPAVKEIILVANSKNKKTIAAEIKKFRIGKVRKIIAGGERRQDSVYQGLQATDRCADLVLIHDGVRPFIDQKILSAVIKEAEICGAAIVGVPVKATIKEVHSPQCPAVHSKYMVKKTIDRENLWEIQTPQVFRRDLILKAYKRFADIHVTDDAMLVEKLGAKVNIVPGSYSNIKITTPEDLIIAKAILKYNLRRG